MSLNESYIGSRPDIQALVPLASQRVLDVGCATGSVGAALKARGVKTVVRVELDGEMAALARDRLDHVVQGDAAAALAGSEMGEQLSDTIIFADVLDSAHLRIETTSTNYRLLEAPHGINRYARYLALPGLRGFLAFQYVVRAVKIAR